MTATAPELRAAAALGTSMDLAVNLAAAVAMVLETLAAARMMTIVLQTLMVLEILPAARVMTLVLESPAVAVAMALETLAKAKMMTIVLETLAVAQVAMAQATSLEAALVVATTHTLVEGPAMMAMTLRMVCDHLMSYF